MGKHRLGGTGEFIVTRFDTIAEAPRHISIYQQQNNEVNIGLTNKDIIDNNDVKLNECDHFDSVVDEKHELNV